MVPLSPRKRHAVDLFSGLPSQYNWMGAALSFGQDPRWRRRLVAEIAPAPGQRILDVATGTGMVAFELAARGSDVIGVDQSEAMLGAARRRLTGSPDRAARKWLRTDAQDPAGRISFVQGEAEQLPFADGEFDALTFTYLLRYVDDRAATLRELARVVKPGGRIGMVEFGVPRDPALRALWRAHTRLGLPLVGRLVSSAWFEVGRFLGPNIEELYRTSPDLSALWTAAGISEVTELRMSFGAGVVMWGVRDGNPT